MDANPAPITVDPGDDPIAAYARWLAEVTDAEAVRYPTAACLATVDAWGAPDARVVLVPFVTADGAFVFSTDARSTKARQLRHHPLAALTFDWSAIDRQVRVRGTVTRADDATADRCYDERPRGSRITGWASVQSRALDDPAGLARRYASAEAGLRDVETVPRPPDWRAYQLRADRIELWHARRHRLHDRWRYTRRGTGWHRSRLEP